MFGQILRINLNYKCKNKIESLMDDIKTLWNFIALIMAASFLKSW